MSYNYEAVAEPIIAAYMDLGGGLNTKKDAHALSRNQLAISVNGWYATGRSFSKRPGNQWVATPDSGGTRSGAPGQGMVGCRYANGTNLIVQSANQLYTQVATLPAALTSWSLIPNSAVGAGGRVRATQLQDPISNTSRTFLVTGKDAPRGWDGSGGLVGLTGVPLKLSGAAAPIQPKYVSSLFSSLFYSGDSSDPSALWISDPFQPESFTLNALLGSPSTYGVVNGTYIPYFIGRNDGIGGGDITGHLPLGGAMGVYKQSAIYALSLIGLYGESLWRTDLVSASVGMVAPDSLVAFDAFHCFLGIDGVYTTTLAPNSGAVKISGNVPTLFDGSFGRTALCLDRTTAVGVRMGNKYLLFFDDGNGTGVPAGHPTSGVWFDFDKLDEDGLPCAGQIAGMAVAGAVPLRGPRDDGTFAWCDGTQDVVGRFGYGSADFGNPITTTLAGKADFMEDLLQDPTAPATQKVVDFVTLFLSIPQQQQGESLAFQCVATLDQLSVLPAIADTLAINVPTTGAVVGTAVVGDPATATLGLPPSSALYQVVKAPLQSPATGKVIQIGFSEASIYPWTLLGYAMQVAVNGLGGLDA